MSHEKFSILSCKVEPQIRTFYYIWNINQFFKTFQFTDTLKLCTDELDFHLTKDKDIFNIFVEYSNKHCVIKSDWRMVFYVFLETNEGKKLYVRNNMYVLKETKILCTIPLKEINLIDGSFIIHFEVDILESILQDTIYDRTLVPFKNVFTDATNLIKDKSKVTFVVDKKYIYTNKTLVCSKSTVFKTMINSGLKESISDKIEITDISYYIFNQLITFIETGRLFCMHEEIMHELFIAADKYDVQDLKLVCENYFMTKITIGNVLKYLDIAQMHNGERLKSYAERFIKLHLNNIYKKEYEILRSKFSELFLQI